MVTIGMNYSVIEGKNEVFEKAFTAVLGAMNTMEGHKKSHLFKDTQDSQSYLIVSDWDDEQAFRDFISSDKFKTVTDWGKEQILKGRPSHQVYKHS